MLNEDKERAGREENGAAGAERAPDFSVEKKMIRDRSGDAISVPYLLLLVIGLPYTAQTAIPLGATHPSALLI